MAEQDNTFRMHLSGPGPLDVTHFSGTRRDALPGADFLFEENPLAMFVYDKASLRLVATNARALDQYGYTREEFLALSLNQLLNDPAPIVHDPSAENLLASSERVERHRTKSGGSLTVEVRERQALAEGRTLCLVVAMDITENKKEQARWQTIAMQDSLTGLANRISLEERARQALITARRNGHRVAILCIDLDRFKQINDWYGHSIGDECLKELGSRLTRRLRGMDVVARVGGEEFTVVLAEVESAQSAMIVANFLLQAIGKVFEVENHTLTMGASIGVAVYPDHGTESDELQRLADLAMYRAKRAGGNRAFIAQESTDPYVDDGSHMEACIRTALAEETFQLHYQLEYRPNGTVRGMEALLRLPRQGGGFIEPDRFIPVAEESGLIYPIGYWVLAQACRQLKMWNTPGREPMRIAVNVSPLQLLRPDYAVSVMNVVQEWGIEPSWLELEITERVVVNFDEVAKGMRLLHSQGIRFAIDDFGTGYSSLQHLNRLPISTVKIDRSFVNRICDANGSYPIVEAIVAMGHSLKMEVIAEGVEKREQRAALERIGVDGMQGHLLARPASIDEIEAILGLSAHPDGTA
ncbi:putative bifunctional diguanylate cyclase/phosphodiesterase [Granulicella tundricola]|uniref:Diguanylate cyclase/phosphodiesterase with PAS/PAC sensor(S) n=1 Tax=Granulicella tundricola (strain ATCC BAA-1859 / DSM 23138 / MP5ACTX9) TaxID=1198114 RepID=E8WXZ2_GRATM|nr:GGDEF and EAL domain-containing protein [Granulicella tundricola]ADW67531.1 diguanylate cyclase/phosphodiesterase with PAS/PAC sensor(s) [Granulicella tundricola MP5ACTX9]